jgi:hypothetical protein
MVKGKPKISDFGLSKQLQTKKSMQTHAGTLFYMPK